MARFRGLNTMSTPKEIPYKSCDMLRNKLSVIGIDLRLSEF